MTVAPDGSHCERNANGGGKSGGATAPPEELLPRTSVSLAAISYLYSRSALPEGGLSRLFWQRYHLACAGVMLAALILAVLWGLTDGPEDGLLIVEAVAVWAFGASWLMKGFDLNLLVQRTED